MRRRTFLKTGIAFSALSTVRAWSGDSTVPKTLWPFYAFDNGVGRGVWSAEKQAALLKQLGYDGMAYNFTTNKDLESWMAVYDAMHLDISSLYIHTFPKQVTGKQYPADLKATVNLLKGRGTKLWITFRETQDTLDHDAACIRIAREIGDCAAEQGVKVCIYPHANFYVEKALDSLQIAQQAKHPNVMPSYNLCHEFLTPSGPKTEQAALETLRQVAPHAGMVSINGVALASKRYIVPLHEGDLNMKTFLKELKHSGYRGAVGHQFYNIQGEPEAILKSAIETWRTLQPESL